VQARADAAGFAAVPRDLPAPDPAYGRPGARAGAYLDARQLLGLHKTWRDVPEHDGLIGAITRCHRGPARPEAVDAAFRAVLAAPAEHRPADRGMPVAAEAELVWAHWHAVDVGPDDTLQRRVAALIDATEGDDQIRGRIQTEIAWITRDAEEVRLRRIRRDGLTTDQIVAFARALQRQDATVLDLDRPLCRQLTQNDRPRGAILLGALDNTEAGSSSWHANVDQLAMQRRTFALVGCVRDVPATWAEAEAVRAGVLARLEHLRPGAREQASCASTLASLDTQLSPEHLAKVKTWPSGEHSWTWAVLTMYLAIEGAGCVDVPGS
jgi:hypothetical protein